MITNMTNKEHTRKYKEDNKEHLEINKLNKYEVNKNDM